MKIEEIVKTTLETAKRVQAVKDGIREQSMIEAIEKMRTLGSHGDPEQAHVEAKNLLFALLDDLAFGTPFADKVDALRDAFDNVEKWYA